MPSFDGLEPLAPDACRSDHAALCFHWHTKLAALNGGWDKLTDEERAFVGVVGHSEKVAPDGWVSPIASLIDQLGGGMPTADLRMLERLAGMDTPNQERLRFLGGSG